MQIIRLWYEKSSLYDGSNIGLVCSNTTVISWTVWAIWLWYHELIFIGNDDIFMLVNGLVWFGLGSWEVILLLLRPLYLPWTPVTSSTFHYCISRSYEYESKGFMCLIHSQRHWDNVLNMLVEVFVFVQDIE